MPFSRRRFLVWSFAAGLFGQSRRLLAALVSSITPPPDTGYLHCLEAWVNTLLPPDAHSPGAGELGVHLHITEKAAINPKAVKLVRAGCRWLERQAQQQGKTAFAELGEQDRTAVVERAENAAPRSLPRVFFEYTREATFVSYYAHPESWAMLDYPGPPQPVGFTDFARAPKGSSR
jgi:hypothetical protein